MYAEMSFEEKLTWVYAVVTLASFGVYVAVILGRARGVPLVQVPYAGVMLWVIGAGIAACILGSIGLSLAAPGECGRKDERDREIHRFGEYVGQSFLVIGGLAALVLAMLRADHFWIANAVYLGFVLSALLGSAVKLFAYRQGFPSC